MRIERKRKMTEETGLPGVAMIPLQRERAESGQAMIEFIIGLVAVLVLVGGLLQVATLTKTHTEAMVKARRQAGERAMLDLMIASNPEYIRDWQEGADQMRYTADDISSAGNIDAFYNMIVDKAVPDASYWSILDPIPNEISSLRGSSNPSLSFGLIKGSDSRTVDIIPVVQRLIYGSDSINVGCDVWMTWTKGIY